MIKIGQPAFIINESETYKIILYFKLHEFTFKVVRYVEHESLVEEILNDCESCLRNQSLLINDLESEILQKEWPVDDYGEAAVLTYYKVYYIDENYTPHFIIYTPTKRLTDKELLAEVDSLSPNAQYTIRKILDEIERCNDVSY
jgi:hypothetical protein